MRTLFKQDRERFSVPRSVQDVIPIKTIYDDGIFEVGANKYSKTFRFEDINYSVASKEDKGKAQKALEAADAFADKHFAALFDYDGAEKYLRGVLQKRFDPKKLPIAKWREELAVKTAEKDSLYREYNSLKAETQRVEQIRRSVTEIMRSESRRTQPTRTRGVEI